MRKYWLPKQFDLEGARKDGLSEHNICDYLAKQIGEDPLKRCYSLDKTTDKINEDLPSQTIAYCFDIKTAEIEGFSKEKIAIFLLSHHGVKYTFGITTRYYQ